MGAGREAPLYAWESHEAYVELKAGGKMDKADNGGERGSGTPVDKKKGSKGDAGGKRRGQKEEGEAEKSPGEDDWAEESD